MAQRRAVRESRRASDLGAVTELEECFQFFDFDNDGLVDCENLGTMLRSLGQYWTVQQLRELEREFPPGGKVSLEEFERLARRERVSGACQLAELREVFEVFDRTRQGAVLLEDLQHILSSIGETLTREEVIQLCELSGVVWTPGKPKTVTVDQFINMQVARQHHSLCVFMLVAPCRFRDPMEPELPPTLV